MRLREKRYVGTQAPCPECQTLLRVVQLTDAGVVIERAPHGSPAPSSLTPATEAQAAPTSKTFHWLAGLQSPLVISWTVAVLAALSLGTVWWLDRPPSLPQPDSTAPAEVAGNLASPAEAEVVAAPTLADRWASLGKQLADYEASAGHFPVGATEGAAGMSGWSWQAAMLAQESPELTRAMASQGWDDAASERLVRRRRDELLNPALDQRAGDNGYPTSHFAGSAGIGPDGPVLPPSHPRAGMFGLGKPRHRDDVRDGLSQTIAVYGIEKGLGSWAEGGPATMRSLTAEPYVRGPDGLGTGSNDRMSVLMADGSVRDITTLAEARLVRRMAAIADGLPLDADVPGEPGESPSTPTLPAPAAVSVEDPPVSALTAALPLPALPVIQRPDPRKVLAERLDIFDQSVPAPRQELLSVVEDLLDRRLAWNPADENFVRDRLRQSLVVRMENVTVSELIERILQGTELTWRVERDTIELLRSESASSPP